MVLKDRSNMTYSEYKARTFAEHPEVKAEYDRFAPQYEVIRAAITSRKEAAAHPCQAAAV